MTGPEKSVVDAACDLVDTKIQAAKVFRVGLSDMPGLIASHRAASQIADKMRADGANLETAVAAYRHQHDIKQPSGLNGLAALGDLTRDQDETESVAVHGLISVAGGREPAAVIAIFARAVSRLLGALEDAS